MKKENSEISLAMRAITFMIMLKQIIYGSQPNGQSDELEGNEEEEEEEEEYGWEETEDLEFKAELNRAIAKQLPDDLKGNMELAELIRHTFYQNYEKEEVVEIVEGGEETTAAEHISDS